MPPLSPAVDLFRLLCASCARPDQAAVPDRNDWDGLVAAARRHGLVPQLYWRLIDNSGAPRPPTTNLTPQARTALRNGYLSCLNNNLQVREQLAAVVESLAAGGITPILLKGAHLAFAVYPDPGLRPMGDIDLLVEPSAVRATAASLEALGYLPTRPFHLESELRIWHHLPPFRRPACHFIEVHWALLRPDGPYRIDTAGLRARSRPAGIPGIPARVLDPADLLVHLCLHAAAADRFSGGLKQLADIVETVRVFRGDPALRAAPARAAAWGAARCLSLSLSLCNDLAPGALPPDLLRALVPEPVAGERLALARTLVLDPPSCAVQISPNLARTIGAPPAPALRGILRGFFPSRTFLSTFYGIDPRSASIWPSYPRRWAYLLGRYAVPALRAMCGDRRASFQTARRADENALSDWLAGIE